MADAESTRPQPAFTFRYPAERRPTAPRFRGVLRLQTEPPPALRPASSATSAPRPALTISIALGGHREPGQKIKILDYFDFNLSRCSFCGLCAEVCPTKPIKALIMSEDYELGSYSRETQILRVDQMYDARHDRALPRASRHPARLKSRIREDRFLFRVPAGISGCESRPTVRYPSQRHFVAARFL